MKPEVIIISGTFAPPFGIKHYPYAKLIELFEKIGLSVHLESIPLLGIGRIDSSLSQLTERYFYHGKETEYILVGHSQGGLLALALANHFPDRVISVEVFGSPFYGTRLAPTWFPFPSIKAMNHRSRWLSELRKNQNLDPSKVHSYFSALDALVVPWFASMVDGGNNYLVVPRHLENFALVAAQMAIGDKISRINIIYATVGHVSLVNSPAVIHSVSVRHKQTVR